MENIIETLNNFFEYQDKIDLYFLIIILIIDSLLWKVNTRHWVYFLVSIIVIGFILPDCSCSREIQREVAIHGDGLDGFNLFYALFVFPKYWFILIVQLLFLLVKPKRQKLGYSNNDSEILDSNFG